MVVSGNFDRERADYIHGEAEELSLIFRTSKLYDDTLRRRVHQYLKDFLRVQLSKKTPSTRECAQLIDSIEAIDRTLDLFLLDYRQRNATAEADIKNLIPLLTKASSKYYLLLYSFMERTPVPMMVTLILLSFTMAFLVGFMNSFQETPNNVIPVIFFITTVLMITGIRDLDNPSRGLITPRYEELEDIQKLIKNSR